MKFVVQYQTLEIPDVWLDYEDYTWINEARETAERLRLQETKDGRKYSAVRIVQPTYHEVY